MESPQQRPRSKSVFSFKSDKSNSSSSKQPKFTKEQLKETTEEKFRNRIGLKSKANPNSAMNEAQPSEHPFLSMTTAADIS